MLHRPHSRAAHHDRGRQTAAAIKHSLIRRCAARAARARLAFVAVAELQSRRRRLASAGQRSDRGMPLEIQLLLRGGAPKKKDKGKGKGKGKGDKGESKAPLGDGDEMTEESWQEQYHIVKKELTGEREERNFFQLERDKINTFWEITKKELEDRKAELRNKDREMEELEERHQVEIKATQPATRSPMPRPTSRRAFAPRAHTLWPQTTEGAPPNRSRAGVQAEGEASAVRAPEQRCAAEGTGRDVAQDPARRPP